MSRFLKNLAFIVFHNALIGFFFGIYKILADYKTGFPIIYASVALLILTGLIANYYHKRNIHVEKTGLIIGIITSIVFILVLIFA